MDIHDRLTILQDRHGWIADRVRDGVYSAIIKGVGPCCRIEGFRGKAQYTAWMSIDTGCVYRDGIGKQQSWEEFIDWLENRPEPVQSPWWQGGLFDFGGGD